MTPRETIEELRTRMGQAILGQEQVIDRLLLTLLCNGNALLEGLPGLAKTRAVRGLAENLDAELKRIQFTPDLLPADITGSEMYLGEDAEERFVFQPGPIFGNMVLADEINRAPAKVQSALLEAMEERQVTIAGKSHPMADLFMVLATQNPIEQEGTYPLPEAQMDRFLMHIQVNYPAAGTELEILRLVRGEQAAAASDGAEAPPPAMSQQVVFDARVQIAEMESSPTIEQYIVDIIRATREPAAYDEDLGRWLQVGASPRGTLALDRVSRAHAWLKGRERVTPDDVRAVVHDCLRHRLTLSYEANADGITADEVVDRLLTHVAIA